MERKFKTNFGSYPMPPKGADFRKYAEECDRKAKAAWERGEPYNG